jgi:hypothetical protein
MTIGLPPCSRADLWLGDFIDLKLSSVTREYCHIVQFPRGWKIQRVDEEPDLMIDYDRSDYEFRVRGLLGSWFLVGSFTPKTLRRYDATTRYLVNLSDPTARALPANTEDWNAATVVPLVRNSIFIKTGTPPHDVAVFHGFQLKRSGARWALNDCASRLSPDSAWLVLQSSTEGSAEAKARLVYTQQVFFDVFSADTGRKLFTIQGTYSGSGNETGTCLRTTGWLTERYFVIPLGKHRERCVVCELRSRQSGAKQ